LTAARAEGAAVTTSLSAPSVTASRRNRPLAREEEMPTTALAVDF